MQRLNLELEFCYGIKKLSTSFDFSNSNVVAIYAPNGAMKSSLAQTFKDLAVSKKPKDRIFPARETVCEVSDERDAAIPPEGIVVIEPYDEVFGHNEKTSTLLVDSTLRHEYEALHVDIDQAKGVFLKAMKEVSRSKKDLEKEISSAFTKGEDEFYVALLRIKEELKSLAGPQFKELPYDTIFNEKVLAFLDTKNFRDAIQEYIEKYNELLAASMRGFNSLMQRVG